MEYRLSGSDARLMTVNNNGVDICYSIQTAVDSKHKLNGGKFDAE